MVDSELHCLCDCPYSREVYLRLDICSHSLFFAHGDSATWVKMLGLIGISTSFLAGLWWVWQWRNNMIMGDDIWEINVVVKKALLSHDEWCKFLDTKELHQRLLVSWSPPPMSFLKINRGFQKVILETDSSDAATFVQCRRFNQCHTYVSTVKEIFALLDRDCCVQTRHVYRDVKCSVDWLAKYSIRNCTGSTFGMSLLLSLVPFS